MPKAARPSRRVRLPRRLPPLPLAAALLHRCGNKTPPHPRALVDVGLCDDGIVKRKPEGLRLVRHDKEHIVT